MEAKEPVKFCGIFSKDLERQFVKGDLLKVLQEFGNCTLYDVPAYTQPPEAELVEALKKADVILTGWGSPRLPLSLLEHRPLRLKYICNITGTIRGWIPKAYIEAGILVTNWGGAGLWYLAEGNLMLMLAMIKELPKVQSHIAEGKWDYPFAAPSPTLRRKTVGFVGFGATAHHLFKLLKPFDCQALVCDPYVEELPKGAERCQSLESLFERSDVITIQCGLTEQTTGMIGKEVLRRTKPNAILVNTARGGIFGEAELIEFLRERPDVFAGLDVFEKEPLPADSPLRRMRNVICYPHSVGSGGEQAEECIIEQAARNIHAFCTGGKLDAVITAEKYGRMT